VNGAFSAILEWWHPDISTALAMRIVDMYNYVLNAIILTPNITVKGLNLFGTRDRVQILEWNAKLPEVVDKCVHEVIQEQVLARPDAEAVCSWDGAFTYSELDRLASTLATYLVHRGIGPEKWVPLCFEKSVSFEKSVLDCICKLADLSEKEMEHCGDAWSFEGWGCICSS
jgi:non-ribosomal peptide synthetase component F